MTDALHERSGPDQQIWVANLVRHPLTSEPIAVHLQRRTNSVQRPVDLPIWVWDLPASPGPPRLHLTSAAQDFLGVPTTQRDRTIYGTADFFNRLPHAGDALSHVEFLHATGEVAEPAYFAETPRMEPDGAVQMVSITEIRIRESRYLMGVGGLPTAESAPQPASVGAAISDQMAESQGRHIALVDIRFPAAIYVIRWIGGWPPGVGHGFSTGQAGGVDEKDVPAIANLVQRAAERRVPMAPDNLTETVVGIRTTDGSFQQMVCSVWFVDRQAAPSVVAADMRPATPGVLASDPR